LKQVVAAAFMHLLIGRPNNFHHFAEARFIDAIIIIGISVTVSPSVRLPFCNIVDVREIDSHGRLCAQAKHAF
jgi:hypothetical protein